MACLEESASGGELVTSIRLRRINVALSSIPVMVGNTRFELVTSTMSMWRSNQLS